MRYLLILFFVAQLSMGVSGFSAQEPTAIENTLIPCEMGLPENEIVGETIQCGQLTVPENWQMLDGRPINLRYVVLKTASQSPFPDPVIYLEGGPGASALVNVPFLVSTFAEIRRYRDVIIYDQRGTSFSTPLFCPSDLRDADIPDDAPLPMLPTSSDPEIQAILDTAITLSGARAAFNCRPYLEAQGFDLSQYSTANSVLDLIALMDALEYPAYNIYGISYGTNLALELFRYYEENGDSPLPVLRSAVIDGVVPPNVDTRGGQAYIVPYNLLRLFDDCEALSDCASAFPNIRERAVNLLRQTAEAPLSIGDETIEFDQLRLVMVNSFNYRDNSSGRVSGIGVQYLPLMIDELEQGILTAYIGLRDGTLPPEPAGGDDDTVENIFGTIASEASTLAESAHNLADEIDQLELRSQRASDALASGLPLPEFFIQEVRIGINGLNFLQATFLPSILDGLLAEEPSQEYLEGFASVFGNEVQALALLLSDEDVEEVYRLLADMRPTIEAANTLALNIISCNDRYGSFDLESLFEGFRSFEVPQLINKTDVAVNGKVVCTLLGLTDASTTLPLPVVTDLPIMVTNGSIDAETPIEWGEAAYESLTNAYFVTFAYAPHGASTQFDCGPAVTAAFFLDPSRMPETSCAAELQTDVFPFVLSADE